MPEISSFYGIIIYMYYKEHQPPHFHVWYNEYQCEITIKDGIITGQLPRRAARELMENWNRSERKEALLKIEPLK